MYDLSSGIGYRAGTLWRGGSITVRFRGGACNIRLPPGVLRP